MSYLLDTTVISEMMRAAPNPGVEDFVEATDDSALFTSVLVVGEVLFGLARLPAGARKQKLLRRFREMRESRFPRVLPLDERSAELWAENTADALGRGITIPAIDGLIAATARSRGFLIVTRNTRDFARAGAKTLNPWT